MTMSTPLSLEDLKRFRSIVETGTPLDKHTVLNIISHAGHLQEHFGSALEANQALVEQLARTKNSADTYQELYEQRAESLEQAEDSERLVTQVLREVLEALGSGPETDPIIKARQTVSRLEQAEVQVAQVVIAELRDRAEQYSEES